MMQPSNMPFDQSLLVDTPKHAVKVSMLFEVRCCLYDVSLNSSKWLQDNSICNFIDLMKFRLHFMTFKLLSSYTDFAHVTLLMNTSFVFQLEQSIEHILTVPYWHF